MAIARPQYGAALAHFLSAADVVPADRFPADTISMFTTFSCVDLARHQRMVWTISYPEEADFSLGRICVFSPLGIAFLGTRRGGVSECKPALEISLRFVVQEILFQPEAAGVPELNKCRSCH
ncbi:GreA/GreB family elongation factor [Cupriavidus sp. TA19]|nr:GreA/GreB family elongation factor [Cupriavidus sp. TA19]